VVGKKGRYGARVARFKRRFGVSAVYDAAMIIRRIADAFRQQDWRSVAMETLIVLLGVFLGLQADNWNSAREDHARARGYLERIRNDLESDRASYTDRIRFWGTVADFGKIGLAYAETGDAGDRSQWELLLAYFHASQVAELLVVHTTYDELKSAGELGLIYDLPFRSRLAFYYTNADNVAFTERPDYRKHVRGIIPVDIQDYIWDHCFEEDPAGGQTLLDCPPPIDPARTAQLVERISRDEALMEELRYWVSAVRVAAIIADNGRVLVDALLVSVKAQLGETPQGAAASDGQ
jgi:hypothetical protein